MSGYREHSYDPLGYERQGPPMRPFNWVQWGGVALSLFGAGAAVYYLLGKAGLVPQLFDHAVPALMFALVGTTLINSRRQPGAELTAETRRKRLLIIAGAFAIAALVAAAVILTHSKGA